MSDHQIAHRIAAETGELLVDLRARLTGGGAPPGRLKIEGDQAAHQHIVAALTEAAPDDAVLSEEGKDDPARLAATRTWIVDPLDGTREFSEPPRTDWAVHVALVRDEAPIAGAVSLPGLGLTLSTADPPPVAPRRTGPPRLVVSRTRPPREATLLAEALGGELVEMGSAGAKTMAVVLGEVDIYAHSGGQYEWDSCAPVAVAQAAGIHTSRLDGSPLRYNQPDPYLPDLLICRPEYAQPVLDALSRS